MKENKRNDKHNEQKRAEEDQLRDKTMNETIRDVNNDRDIEQNETLRNAEQGSGRSYDYGAEGSDNQRKRGGLNYDQQDTSGTRGGTVDMDDQTVSGAGRATPGATGTGSGLAPKTGVTGSDYDGQNATS